MGTVLAISFLVIYGQPSHAYCPRRCVVFQWRSVSSPGSGTEKMPVKGPHTKIKPLALPSGHGRYIAATPQRTLTSVGKLWLRVL
jgi:hypothetical protein